MSDEKSMHRTMMARDTASGAVKGGVVGALAGLAGKRPKAGTAVGAALGATLGGLRGHERVLKDKVKEQRMDDRYARRHPRLKAAADEGFFDELEKLAVSEKWVFEKALAAAKKNPEKAGRRAFELAGQTGERSAKRGAHLKGLMAGWQSSGPGKTVERVIVKTVPKEVVVGTRPDPKQLVATAAIGGAGGYLLGKDSMLKHQKRKRAELEGFFDELEKQAFLAPLATTVGTKAMQMGTRVAKAVGQGDNWSSLLRKGVQASSKGNFARNVGYGVMGAGTLGAGAAAGAMMNRGQQQ